MGNSLLRKDVLDRLKIFNGKIKYKDRNDILVLEGIYKKIPNEMEEIVYKFFLNDKILLLKTKGYQNNGGYRWNKEEFYILDGYIYNDLNSNSEAIFHKDGYIYSNDRVSGNNVNYEVNDNLFVAIPSLSLINVYYDFKTKEIGIMINDRKYKIDENIDIEVQVKTFLEDYYNKVEDIKSKIKVLLTDEIFNKQKSEKCYKIIGNTIDEYLNLELSSNQLDNIINEINNIRFIYDNYIDYKYNAEIKLSKIYKVSTLMERLLIGHERKQKEQEYEIEYKELKKQLMRKYSLKDID